MSDYITIKFGRKQGKERFLQKGAVKEYGFCENYYEERIFETGYAKNQVLFLKVNEQEVWEMGDFVFYLGEQFFVYQREFEIKQGEFKAFYILGTRGFLWKKKREPIFLAGAKLVGTVKRVERELVYVQFDIEEKQESNQYPWEWTPETGNFSYCMPEQETKVIVYFPTQKAEEGKAIAVLSKNKRQGIVSQKEFVTEAKKYLGLWEKELFLQGKREDLKVSFLDKKGISFSSDKGMQLGARANICIKGKRIIANACIDFACETEMANIEISKNFNFYAIKGIQTKATKLEKKEKNWDLLFRDEIKKISYRQASYAILGALPVIDLNKTDTRTIIDLAATGAVAKIGSGTVTIVMRDIMNGVPEEEVKCAEALDKLDIYTFKNAHPLQKYMQKEKNGTEDTETENYTYLLPGMEILIKIARFLGKSVETIQDMMNQEARVVCTRACMKEGEEGHNILKDDKPTVIGDINSKDIKFVTFSECKFKPDSTPSNLDKDEDKDKELKRVCKPFIEENSWKRAYNGYIIENKSYMICQYGYGLIYLSSDGKRKDEIEVEVSNKWINKWWEGYTREGNESDYQKTKSAIEILTENSTLLENRIKLLEESNQKEKSEIEILLNKKDKIFNFTPYINEEQLKLIGYKESLRNSLMIADLNRMCKKYEITSKSKIEHLLAQCLAEAGDTKGLRGFPIEYGGYEYYKTLSYYPYIGAGHLQVINDYTYMVFALFKAKEAYPELDIIAYNPAHWISDYIKGQYNKLKSIEKNENNNLNLSIYTKIYEPQNNSPTQPIGDASYYIAKYFPWETAGYFWKMNEINEKLKSVSGDDAVDKITEIVNYGADSKEKEKRRKLYKEIVEKNLNFGE